MISKAVRDRFIAEQRPKCSGVSARWCPIHGNCTCDEDEDFNDWECALHSPKSSHAEDQ